MKKKPAKKAAKNASKKTSKKAATKKGVKKTTAKKTPAKKSTAKKKAASKNRSKATTIAPLRFEGQKLFFAGKPARWEESVKQLKQWAQEEGAVIQTTLNDQTDQLIIMPQGATAKPKAAAAKLNQQGAKIVETKFTDFLAQFRPTADEVIDLIRAGGTASTRLTKLLQRSRSWHLMAARFDLKGVDLRGADLRELHLTSMDLEGADLRNVKIFGTEFRDLKNCDFSGATGDHFRFDQAKNCNFQNAKLDNLFAGWHTYHGRYVENCDFTGARLRYGYCNYSSVKGTIFRSADLTGFDLHDCQLYDCDFTNANLTQVNLAETAVKKNVKFTGANFTNARLSETDFSTADLSKATFSGANLCLAKFAKANLAGADFKGAILFGADFKGCDTSKAKNLELHFTPAKAGKACKSLATAGRSADVLQVDFSVKLPGGKIAEIQATAGKRMGHTKASFRFHIKGISKEPLDVHAACSSMSVALVKLAEMFGHGEVLLDTLKTSTSKSKVKGKALTTLVEQAISEAFKYELPTEQEVQAKKKSAKQKASDLQAEVLENLRGGQTGVKAFHEQLEELKLKKFKGLQKADLSGAKLSNLRVTSFTFSNCNFDDATLKKAKLSNCDLRKSTFRNANAAAANLSGSDVTGCDFTNADLSGADFRDVPLIGVSFVGAKLTSVKWRNNPFDENTTFSDGYKIPNALVYTGKGEDPRAATTAAATDIQDVAGLLDELKKKLDAGRLQKALKMLKADRFELFTDVTDSAMLGVVRSQSDRNLVYSCRLTSGGEFCCCTQNLNACGGLSGKLCKHLLVLLIGLTKADSLTPTDAATWARASLRRKPVLDKEAMAETLLKYKQAEAGEIDWRPTETLPEDFVAF